MPGDIVLLRAGDRVPADARLTLSINLAIDEAALTGESAAVGKTARRLDEAALGLGDRLNMVYAGTLVTYGRGQAGVVATGMASEFGRISALVQTVEAGRTPLQENRDRLASTGYPRLPWRSIPLNRISCSGAHVILAPVSSHDRLSSC